MKPIFTCQTVGKKARGLLFFFMLLLSSSATIAQLGVYDFTGAGACPNQNPSVAVPPLHSTFSNFTSSAGNCVITSNAFSYTNLNTSNGINLSEYFAFTITPSAGYTLNLTSLSFSNFAEQNQSGNHWNLRSSLDNYTADLGTAPISASVQTPVVNLPAASFGNTGAVTFRIYVVKMQSGGAWTVDDVTLNGSEIIVTPDPGNPTSNSPQCSTPGVTITASGTPPAGVSWYWETTAAGTSTANNASTSQTVTTSGTYYIRAQDDGSLAWSTGAGSIAVTIIPNVSTPSFTGGASSTRCQGAGTVNYPATASNSSGISYSLDATTAAFPGNSINSSTGAVTYAASWSGTTTVTASAAGCSGPLTATHVVTTASTVGTPVFTLGATTTRCQGTVSVTYGATANFTTGITYSLDATTAAFAGNSINSSTGTVTYAAGWSGTTTITASAAGCNGPLTATHVVTITPTVGTPVFTLGATSTRCQSAGTVSYTANSTNNTGITYTLDGTTSAYPGNSINAATGDVTYAAGWTGPSTITASATGCNGPKTANHTVTTITTIPSPTFTLGATSTRCQGGGSVTYIATSAGSTGMSYVLDAMSLGNGNSINAATGAVSYSASWSGTSTITATATGCNGPTTSTHTVTITPTVGTPIFVSGASSVRCQGGATITYTANATNTTGITYSIDVLSAVLNSVNPATGTVIFSPLWFGSTIITASAAGCNGPKTATHTVTVTATVGNPVFTLGATSNRCQVAGTVAYTATSANSSGITYTLDATSSGFGNTIDPSTGTVTYLAGWTGASTITATATGCNGPKLSSHTATTNTTVGPTSFTLGATSTRCQGAGTVTYTATASNTTGITYVLDAVTDAYPGNSINSGTGAVTYAAGWSGTSTITATAAGCSGPTLAVHTVTTTPTVGTPVFTSGATSTRCQGAGAVTYTANSTNNTGITYTLDGPSTTFGNTINPATGAVTYLAGWSGTSIITASATGCNGPKTANHTVTITPTVGTPVFTLGATSTRCLQANSVTYTANATNNTGITYTLDALSLGGSNTINPATGTVSWNATWTGTSTITATATGCNGPSTASHTVTTNAAVAIPAFTLGASSTRCQGAGVVTYDATANNTTGITYTLDATTDAYPGNSINTATGAVTFAAGWAGNSTVTASAAGCNGPKTAVHSITTTPTVGTPIFTAGASTTRCQGAGTVTYTVTSSNNTGITYTLDGPSTTFGNTINSATGAVTYLAGWAGTSVITATATGCNGPKSANHTVTITASVGTPVFVLGATTTRCQGGGTVTYAANATTTTGITYTLDGASTIGGNTINSTTGAVAYSATWSGTTIITASAAGCSGPVTATHTVTVTPTVGTPIFTLGASSTRCQGAGTVTYTSNATNNTSISYSIDGTSSAAGNTINAATGDVSYVAGWNGTTTIIVIAMGCNGPKTSTHVVTVTPTVGVPAFALGTESVRTQGAGTVTYTATATNNTGITYILDAASLSGGNTINAATGAVTWTAGWNGTSMITATATGCNGPSSSSHIVTINASVVQTPLYLSDPGYILDRVDPVATGIVTTIQTGDLSTSGTTSVSFTQNPALCSDLVIKAQTISVLTYVSIASGTMPASPAITATLKYGATNIITLSNPVYNSGTHVLTWTGTLGADVTVPSGQAIELQITTAQAGVVFKIEYHSMSKPSRISLLPVSTFIDITSFNVYNAAYPGGSIRISGNPNTTYYARAVVTTPFGYKDITGMTININPPAANFTATCVDSTTCTRTYEYSWTTSATTGNYFLMATAREGYENIIKNSELLSFSVCAVCAPVAVTDSAVGAGGAPVTIDALANDYDPNNNISPATLTVFTQPNNGSGYVSNGTIVYLPNGSFAGRDTLSYRICDATGLCAIGQIFVNINPFLVDPCSEATKNHTYYLPFSENEARIALDSSTNTAFPSNNIRTIISMKMPYPGMTIVWDHWEDGYEINPLNPMQSTTQVWGDGNPYNGIAPGYSSDIIPAGGSIVLDNIVPTNPRVAANIFWDGKDKIVTSGQITLTQVCGEPSIMPVQCMKTNVSSTLDYGTSFTIPVGQNYGSQDFRYTSLFIRGSKDNTTINIDKDNNGTFETTATINEGQVYHVNGGVMNGATVTATLPVGIDLHFGGNDSYSSRDVPIFPATWYYHTYYSPVPTTGSSGAIKDTAAVLLYNSLSRPLTINWSSGIPSSGSINLPAKGVVRFPLALSATAAYKFTNPTGESFTAIEICDSYTPGGGGNTGLEYDWSFNLIAQNRLTDFATVAWAPGSLDGTRNDNPVWVTPTNNTTIYVKYDGDISGNTGLLSPCGMRYDVSYTLNALSHRRLRDPNDNDQSGLAVYTCDGTKLAAVYGEDASTAVQANPSWDVGSTIQPFCKQKLIFANDDYARTMVSQSVTIPVLLNDFGWLAVVDPATVNNTGLLMAHHGSITINSNGTINYMPIGGYVGKDTFEYQVCSTPSPIVCDIATVYVDISSCPAPFNANVIGGQVWQDKNEDGIYNDGGVGVAGAKVYLYVDGNCNTTIQPNELQDSIIVDASGTYQFVVYPERFVQDNFDGPANTTTCASGNDGSATWIGNWTDLGDPSVGFCVGGSAPANDAEIVKDGAFSYALRLKDNNVSATRTVNLSGASYAFLSFSYRRKSATLGAGEDVIVQASKDGTTFGTIYTIAGDGTTDANYVTIYNQDITFYANAVTYIRFLTNNNVDDQDTVYIDDVKVQFLRYPQCYITRFDTSSIPMYYHTTTAPLQHAFTATSSSTCLSPYHFGIARDKISLSGNLYNDANGLTDNLINGPAMGIVASNTVYAYLRDSTGLVVYRTTLNAAGAYTFPAVDVATNYTLMLSTTSVNVGDPPPALAYLPTNWIATGDAFGTNNQAGLGLKPGLPTCSVAITTGTVSISNVNFGIERLPDSDPRNVNYQLNVPGVQYDIIGGLTGLDAEDGVLGAGKTYKITSLPTNAVLIYNGIAVTLNQLITGFNASLLKIDPDDPTVISTFTYASRDAAGLYDPTPALVTVTWGSVLPISILDFSGKLNGAKVDLFWSTSSESNSDRFDVERSTDGINFSPIGTVKGKGNSSVTSNYVSADPLPVKGMNYYRLKMIDKDGAFIYSKTIAIQVNKAEDMTVKIMPNPFTSKLDIYINLPRNSDVTIDFVDMNGIAVLTKKVKGYKGYNWFSFSDLDKVPSAAYMLKLSTDDGVITQKLIKGRK